MNSSSSANKDRKKTTQDKTEVEIKIEEQSITGYFDGLIDEYIEGWAADKQKLNEAIHIKVVLPNGQILLSEMADRLREDLVSAGIGNGRHGFQIDIKQAFQANIFNDLELYDSNDTLLSKYKIPQSILVQEGNRYLEEGHTEIALNLYCSALSEGKCKPAESKIIEITTTDADSSEYIFSLIDSKDSEKLKGLSPLFLFNYYMTHEMWAQLESLINKEPTSDNSITLKEMLRAALDNSRELWDINADCYWPNADLTRKADIIGSLYTKLCDAGQTLISDSTFSALSRNELKLIVFNLLRTKSLLDLNQLQGLVRYIGGVSSETFSRSGYTEELSDIYDIGWNAILNYSRENLSVLLEKISRFQKANSDCEISAKATYNIFFNVLKTLITCEIPFKSDLLPVIMAVEESTDILQQSAPTSMFLYSAKCVLADLYYIAGDKRCYELTLQNLQDKPSALEWTMYYHEQAIWDMLYKEKWLITSDIRTFLNNKLDNNSLERYGLYSLLLISRIDNTNTDNLFAIDLVYLQKLFQKSEHYLGDNRVYDLIKDNPLVKDSSESFYISSTDMLAKLKLLNRAFSNNERSFKDETKRRLDSMCSSIPPQRLGDDLSGVLKEHNKVVNVASDSVFPVIMIETSDDSEEYLLDYYLRMESRNPQASFVLFDNTNYSIIKNGQLEKTSSENILKLANSKDYLLVAPTGWLVTEQLFSKFSDWEMSKNEVSAFKIDETYLSLLTPAFLFNFKNMTEESKSSLLSDIPSLNFKEFNNSDTQTLTPGFLSKRQIDIKYAYLNAYVESGCLALDDVKWGFEFASSTFFINKQAISSSHNSVTSMLKLKSSKHAIDSKLSALVAQRNEYNRLPFFLDYYRKMGVDHFYFIDNASDDGKTINYLLEQPDVSLYVTPQSYSQGRFGVSWVDHLIRRERYNKWNLVLDPDEFLECKGFDNLSSLIEHLETHGFTALHSHFIDYYSSTSIKSSVCNEGDDITEVCKTHDKRFFSTYSPLGGTGSKYPTYQGGVRSRTFGVDSVVLSKIPLYKHTSPEVYPREGVHWIDNVKPLYGIATLKHYKYISTFHEYVERESARGEHWNGASEYRQYHEVLSQNADYSLFSKFYSNRNS
jgi:hypothetical protein